MNELAKRPHHKNPHTNTFVDLNGIPYIYAEYLEKKNIRQIDRSMVRSEITTETNEAMRKVVNISVNDIGLTKDGYLKTKGNVQKTKELLGMIYDQMPRLDHLLDVMKPGLIMRVHYQLEDASTGYTIATYQDEFRIQHRHYYLDINSRNVNDNAIVTLFNDSMVSCINEFVHGHKHLNVRITTVEMFYEMMSRCLKNVGDNRFYRAAPDEMIPGCYGGNFNYYQFHKDLQPEHMLCPTCYQDRGIYNHNDPRDILPPTWMNFNRFYHFDEACNSIILHMEEINDPHCEVIKVPCGKIHVNRLIRVHPGTRIVYKFMVWKNDITIVNDAMSVAKVLQSPVMNDWCHNDDYQCDCDHNNHHECDPDKERILQMLHDNQGMIANQNRTIHMLTDELRAMKQMMKDHPHHHNPDHFDDGCCCHGPKEEEIPDDEVMCKVDGKKYRSVQEAINDIDIGLIEGEIVLQNNVEEELMITGTIVLDLNDHNIAAPRRIDTAKFHHTIIVDGGHLVIHGKGHVINRNNQGYCVFNAGYNDEWMPDGAKSTSMGEGTVLLAGGTYHRADVDEQHTGYVIVNHGSQMTIGKDAQVFTRDHSSSLVCNGFMNDATSCPVMIINGGHFEGGKHTINNDHGGRMIINDGKFIMPKVCGTEVTPKDVLRNEETAICKICGGEFEGPLNNSNTDKDSLVIGGGKFTVNVEQWLDENYTQEPNGKVVNKV